ncbi:hypothetical protein TNCV_4526661 [Trichonephila clavipes]|nr:hypothetical protein TNCV_4526661 [Trichonephila clavipes]
MDQLGSESGEGRLLLTRPPMGARLEEPTQAYDRDCLLPNAKHGGESVMVFCWTNHNPERKDHCGEI